MQDKPHNFEKAETIFSKIRRPTFCCITISTMCVLKCKMCFLWKNNYVKVPEEPTLREWYTFIELLSDLTDNSIELNVGGGEPLLYEKNLALISFSVKRGLPTSMPSNGFLIDEEMAYKIADSGLNTIGISLDGINKDTHDFLRGTEGCYDKVMQAIGYLNRYCSNLKIGIQTIIFEKNLDEIVSLVEWVNEDERIETISFQAIVQPFNTPFDDGWYNKSEYSFLWPEDIKKVYIVLDELIRLKKAGYKISNSNSQLEAFKIYFRCPQEFIKRNKCGVDSWLNINQLGDVYMCPRKKPIGNIKRYTPEDMWYSEEANQIREEIKNCRINCQSLVNCCYKEE